MCATSPTLATLEVAVAGAGRPFTLRQLVRVHRQAHAAPRLAPIGTRGAEHIVESLGLGLLLHRMATRYDHHSWNGDGTPAHDRGRGAQVLDPAGGEATDKHRVDRYVAHSRAGLQPHVLEGSGNGFASCCIYKVLG